VNKDSALFRICSSDRWYMLLERQYNHINLAMIVMRFGSKQQTVILAKAVILASFFFYLTPGAVPFLGRK